MPVVVDPVFEISGLVGDGGVDDGRDSFAVTTEKLVDGGEIDSVSEPHVEFNHALSRNCTSSHERSNITTIPVRKADVSVDEFHQAVIPDSFGSDFSNRDLDAFLEDAAGGTWKGSRNASAYVRHVAKIRCPSNCRLTLAFLLEIIRLYSYSIFH